MTSTVRLRSAALLSRDNRAGVNLRLASLRALLGRDTRAHAAAPWVALVALLSVTPRPALLLIRDWPGFARLVAEVIAE